MKIPPENKKAFSLHPWQPEGLPAGILRCAYVSPFDGQPDWALLWPGTHHEDWLVNLHGHGSHGDQLFTRPDIRDLHLPFYRKLGLGILSPNLRDNAWMGPAAVSDLHHLLEQVRAAFGARRFFFSSGSMGGTGNLIYAVRHPEDVSGVLALCPATDLATYVEWLREHPGGVRDEIRAAILASYGGTPEELPELYSAHSARLQAQRLTMPVAICHGEADSLIPVSQPRQLERRMKNRNDFHCRYLPGGNHDAPLHDLEMLAWLKQTVTKNT